METVVQVVLSPTESKRLLSKAVLNLDSVKKALDSGILIIHPSSTTSFMLDELGVKVPPEGIWVCGHISPKGLCISRKMVDAAIKTPDYAADKYPFEIILRKGVQLPFDKSGLGPILEEMKAEDVYVKAANAIDTNNDTGILLAAGSSGGSIGLAIKKRKEKKFKMIIPTGLEKKISVSLSQAIRATYGVKKAQGIPCGLWRLRGELITEIEAFKELFDVQATPISAGGVNGAEGCVIFAVRGKEKNVEKAFETCNQIRGYKMPRELDVYDCKECKMLSCTQTGMTLERLLEEMGGIPNIQH